LQQPIASLGGITLGFEFLQLRDHLLVLGLALQFFDRRRLNLRLQGTGSRKHVRDQGFDFLQHSRRRAMPFFQCRETRKMPRSVLRG